MEILPLTYLKIWPIEIPMSPVPGVTSSQISTDLWTTPLDSATRGTLESMPLDPNRYIVDWRGFRQSFYDQSETLLNRIVIGSGRDFIAGEINFLFSSCNTEASSFLDAADTAWANVVSGTYTTIDKSRLDSTYGALCSCVVAHAPLRGDWVPEDPTVAPIFGLGQGASTLISNIDGLEVPREAKEKESHRPDVGHKFDRDLLTDDDKAGIVKLIMNADRLSVAEINAQVVLAAHENKEVTGDSLLVDFMFTVSEDVALLTRVRGLTVVKQKALLEPLATDWVEQWWQFGFPDADIFMNWNYCPDLSCRESLLKYVDIYRPLAYDKWRSNMVDGFVTYAERMGIEREVSNPVLLSAMLAVSDASAYSSPLSDGQRNQLTEDTKTEWERYAFACTYLVGDVSIGGVYSKCGIGPHAAVQGHNVPTTKFSMEHPRRQP